MLKSSWSQVCCLAAAVAASRNMLGSALQRAGEAVQIAGEKKGRVHLQSTTKHSLPRYDARWRRASHFPHPTSPHLAHDCKDISPYLMHDSKAAHVEGGAEAAAVLPVQPVSSNTTAMLTASMSGRRRPSTAATPAAAPLPPCKRRTLHEVECPSQ